MVWDVTFACFNDKDLRMEFEDSCARFHWIVNTFDHQLTSTNNQNAISIQTRSLQNNAKVCLCTLDTWQRKMENVTKKLKQE